MPPATAVAPRRPPIVADNTPDEIELYAVLWRIFGVKGFGAVVAACHKAQKQIARTNRSQVEGQGWIA